jgi:hypothetical protein
MNPEEIESPPYPGEGVNPDGLYNALSQLKTWVDTYRGPLNEEVGQDVIPVVKPLPNKAAYLCQPVLSLFSHMILVRRMREGWDHIVRNFESTWHDRMCVRQRVVLVQSAAVMLNGAFTPFEYRETRRQSELEDLQGQFSRMQSLVLEITEPESHDPFPKTQKGEDA